MRQTADERAYRSALRRGAGRCVTMLSSESARRKYRLLVMWACCRDLGYDTQVEGTRALFLYEMIAVLAGNYREDDDDLLIAALKKLGEKQHDVYAILARVTGGKGVDRLSTRMLAYLYETIRCTHCRNRVVRELGRRGLLTDDMLAECLHDASVDIREYARRILKRRRAKSA